MARQGEGIYLRNKTWILDTRINGTRHVVKLGKGINRTVAKELASVKRAGILKGEAGIGKKKKDCLFEKAKEEFLKWAEANKRPRTVRTYRQCLEHLSMSFTGKRLSEITTWLIEKHKQGRVKGGALVRPNRELAVLKTLFNRCVDWGLFDGDNPVKRVKFLKEPKRRERYLEPEEQTAFFECAPERFRHFLTVWVYTGLRVQAEALTSKWDDVDLRRGLITVQAAYAKSGQTRTVPLNSPARSALEALKATSKGEYVFAKPDGNPYRSIRSVFERACRKAGLKGITPHTLRHTFASRLAMSGVDLRTIQELGGWKELSMVQRYAHLSPSHKAEAVERIAVENFTTFFTTPEKSPLVKVI